MFSKKYLSLEWGSQNIKLVTAFRKNQQVCIEKAVLLALPDELYEEGRFSNLGQAAELIQDGLNRHQIKCRQAVVSLNSPGIIFRELVVPAVKDRELRAMVDYELQRFLPAESGSYVSQHRAIEKVEEEGAAKLKVQVAAMPRTVVADSYELLKLLKLKPERLDISTNGFGNLLRPGAVINESKVIGEETLAFLDIGHRYTTISIFAGGMLRLTRLLEGGGRELPETQNNRNLGAEDITPVLESWGAKILRIIQFYENRNKPGISAAYIYGGTSCRQGVSEGLSEHLNIPVVEISSLSTLTVPEVGIEEKLCFFLNTAGALAANR